MCLTWKLYSNALTLEPLEISWTCPHFGSPGQEVWKDFQLCHLKSKRSWCQSCRITILCTNVWSHMEVLGLTGVCVGQQKGLQYLTNHCHHHISSQSFVYTKAKWKKQKGLKAAVRPKMLSGNTTAYWNEASPPDPGAPSFCINVCPHRISGIHLMFLWPAKSQQISLSHYILETPQMSQPRILWTKIRPKKESTRSIINQ